ncbi:uncharacterized protein TRAVEDRAFT_50153 [Trametes versicolor FP-101664 SS1]|uniref:uncharacterized protein n=1 Tax=Trametes versicolor (strain FP-101664) TaxID=717944 RepID=UPI0004623BF6|nr:uncharacterized protein TRAVEDRAFT_50153 [Trametes versicolor FP-101664 SS1]EIW55668.1 hypothetical protein TRAVEDRAFT_50153 [Trametes versicolor FP-101664 SS1]
MVNPEGQVEPSVIPPLDPALLRLSDEEHAFLRAAITEDEEVLKARIYDVQKRAYEKYPYPCICAFHFVNLMMHKNTVYPSVLAAGKSDSTSLLLDLGCCMGTDVRKLVRDGYPASQVLGCDLRPEYIQLGHELFGDAFTCPVRFFTSNVFDLPLPSELSADADAIAAPPDPAAVSDLGQLRGALTHIYTGALFHLFDEKTQYGLAVRIVTLLKRRPSGVVFGRHAGLVEEGYIDDHLGRKRYGHSESSWPRLWKKAFAEVEGEEFARRVVVEAKLEAALGAQAPVDLRRTQMLYWSVSIV